MPADRSKKLKERLELARRVERCGFEMSPCSPCRRSGRRCIVSDADAARCSECVRSGRGNCDFSSNLPSLGDWASIDRQRRKLRDEEEEAMAKILRLRKQQRFLDDREQEMLRRGLESLDELDKAEEKERKDKEEAERRELEARAAASTTFDLTDDQIVDLGLSSFDPSWATLDFADGNPSTASGS